MTASLPRLVLLVWSFGFFGFAGTTLLSSEPTARIAGALLFGLPVVVWAAVVWRRPVDRLDAAVLFGVVMHLVVSFASRDATASLETSAAVVVYAAVYGVARAHHDDPAVRRTLTLAIVAALLFWLTVLSITWVAEKAIQLAQLGWPLTLDAHQPWVWGSVNTPPLLALLVIPFISWLPSREARGACFAILAAAALVVVPLSVGRSAWLGIAVAAVAAELLLGFPVLRRLGMTVSQARRAALVAGGTGLFGAVALVAVTGVERSSAQLDSRLRLWDQALRLFAADPVTGSGPSTFGWARLDMVPDYVDRVAAREAHSIPMQTLADGGLLLALALAAIVVVWLSLVVQRRLDLGGGARLALAILAGFAAFALLDDLSFLPAVTVIVILLATWSIPSPRGPRRPRRRGRLMPIALLVAGALTVPAVIAASSARIDSAIGRSAAVAGAWEAALQAFERTTASHPGNALNWMSTGLAAAAAGDPVRAMAAYSRAREISPGDPRPWGALAALAGDHRTAIEMLDAAIRRSNDPRYAYRLGEAQLGSGDEVAAAHAYAISASLWPDWLAAVPDSVRADVVAALPDTVELVGPVGGRDSREALWNAGLLVGDLPEDAALPWRALDLARRGDALGARELLGEAPPSARTDLAASAVAMLACDRDAYEAAQARLARRPAESPPGHHTVQVTRSGLYRELELGDYQPIDGPSVPQIPEWPLGLIEVPDCGW